MKWSVIKDQFFDPFFVANEIKVEYSKHNCFVVFATKFRGGRYE
ncbi:hypothetical protein SAMN05216179_1008 [Gracilibacillus kekensis]|uniref:Uncharacterized protein n=1 Tax=Gracilibacillus kekensis TaxID=1027249 RepID=A0A1M7LB50_9BACI|nr:hypothetical protein SAMN05216179_1008 [Gracilibacillus kekensis]